jgi:ethanolamine utilization protein EutK
MTRCIHESSESLPVKNTSLGYLEVQGLANAIVAADAMVKGALVRLVGALELNPGRITISVEGDLAACRAAVDAGRQAIAYDDAALADLVLGRPDPDLEVLTEAMARKSCHKGRKPVVSEESVNE